MSGGGGNVETGFVPPIGTFFMILLRIVSLLPAADELIKDVTGAGKAGH